MLSSPTSANKPASLLHFFSCTFDIGIVCIITGHITVSTHMPSMSAISSMETTYLACCVALYHRWSYPLESRDASNQNHAPRDHTERVGSSQLCYSSFYLVPELWSRSIGSKLSPTGNVSRCCLMREYERSRQIIKSGIWWIPSQFMSKIGFTSTGDHAGTRALRLKVVFSHNKILIAHHTYVHTSTTRLDIPLWDVTRSDCLGSKRQVTMTANEAEW